MLGDTITEMVNGRILIGVKKRILNPKPFLAADVVDGFLLMLLDNQLLNRRNPLKN